VLTDARFSGVSTGACVGHISPEALAGGPIGKVREGDQIAIMIDRLNLLGSIDLVGDGEHIFQPDEGERVLEQRSPRPDLRPHPDLPADTKLWAALGMQAAASGMAAFTIRRRLWRSWKNPCRQRSSA